MNKICLIIIVAAIGSLHGQVERLIYDQLEKPHDAVYYHVPIGLCEDYPEETTTAEILRNDLEFLKKHDVKFMRISFGWDAIETEKGKYNWLFWDDFVKMAVEEYHITLVPYICYTPQWISEGKNDTLFFWNYPPTDYEHFGVFMSKLVNRYKKWIKTWELWNEPDIPIYWRVSTADFARLTIIGAKAVKKADPGAKVVLAGIAYRPEFIEDLFRYHGVSPYVDIINMHNYYETWHRHPVELIKNYVNEVYDVVWRYGDNQSLWMAEVGYSTFRQGAKVSDSYQAYYNYEHTPAYQAIDMIKRLILVLSTEKIAAIAWYELKDLPQTEEVIGDEYNNRYLGVAFKDYKPKPAAGALQFFNALFSQKNRCIDSELIVSRTIGSDSEIHGFENEDDSIILAAWLKTCTPGKARVQKDGMAEDNRRENLNIIIPRELKGQVTVYNETGEIQNPLSVVPLKGETEIRNLTLQGGKVLLIKVEK